LLLEIKIIIRIMLSFTSFVAASLLSVALALPAPVPNRGGIDNDGFSRNDRPNNAFPGNSYDTAYSGPQYPYAIPNHGKVAYAQAGNAVAAAIPFPVDGAYTGSRGGSAVVYP
jgi:hypothetical protein